MSTQHFFRRVLVEVAYTHIYIFCINARIHIIMSKPIYLFYIEDITIPRSGELGQVLAHGHSMSQKSQRTAASRYISEDLIRAVRVAWHGSERNHELVVLKGKMGTHQGDSPLGIHNQLLTYPIGSVLPTFG